MKKQLVILSAAAMVAAAAVPALAVENEFHGMYRAFGYLTNNIYSGGGTFNIPAPDQTTKRDATTSYVEQRARLQYIAKASDDLKLVTHFELDALFGGKADAKYAGSTDAGVLDADGISLETKNVYLDFNIPGAPVNVKLGIQPYSDAVMGTFGNFDGAGMVATAKLGMLTPSFGWFRLANDLAATGGAQAFSIGRKTTDMFAVDLKAAVNKDVTVGGAYYAVVNDAGTTTTTGNGLTPGATTAGTAGSSAVTTAAELIHMFAANVSAKVGPAAIKAFGAYQAGDFNKTRNLAAYALGANGKINVGVGNVNISGLYLSGEKSLTSTGDYKGWQQIAQNGGQSYFNESNMWLLIRNGATINTSTAIGTNDLTKGGRGLMGLFGGFDGAAGKLFYSANVGYAQVAEKRTGEKGDIGTEFNATVGYKLYDNLAVSATGAYAMLGGAMSDYTSVTGGIGSGMGAVKDGKDPYMTNIRVDYTF